MASDSPILTDPLNRQINYLRISVTDRCNLRCVYCMPRGGHPAPAPTREILSYEEIARAGARGRRPGRRQVRLTGGEPLVRRDLPTLVRLLAAMPGLATSPDHQRHAPGRASRPAGGAGLRRVNVSLDTLRPDLFRAITRPASSRRCSPGSPRPRPPASSP